MTADRVAMIDWDDVPDLDVALPRNAAGLDDDAYDSAAQARAAWAGAVCWDAQRDRPIRSQAARRGSSDLTSSASTQPDDRYTPHAEPKKDRLPNALRDIEVPNTRR